MKTALKIISVLAVLAPLPATAEQIGTVTATLDGEEMQWFTISQESGDQLIMTARFKNSDRLSNFTIQAHPEPHFTTTGLLTFDVGYFGKFEEGKAPVSIEITYAPDGLTDPLWATAQTNATPELEFETFDITSDPGHATGTFSADLCLADKLLAEPDMSNCKAINGSFDTDLMVR